MQDGQAKVHFTVETAAAQSLIGDATPRLQAMLENRGVKLEQASVDVGGRADREGQGRQQDAPPFIAQAPPSALAAAARRADRLTAFASQARPTNHDREGRVCGKQVTLRIELGGAS